MGRNKEMEWKLNSIIDKKELDLKNKYRKQVDVATNALYKDWGILSEMTQIRSIENEEKVLLKKKEVLENTVRVKCSYGYNFQNSSESEAMKAMPVFRQLYALKEKMELAILFASSPKQMVKIYEDFVKEINMVE